MTALKRTLRRVAEWLLLAGLIVLALAFVSCVYMLDKFRWSP